MSDEIKIDGIVKQREELERLMMSNPAMEKRVQKLIRKVLLIAKRELGNTAKSGMKNDPRQAYKAVKAAVYKRILGGSVSLLDKRKAGKGFLYEPPRKLKAGQRGGNRVPRSQRTTDVMSYHGADRAFILRFLNAGTVSRTAGSRNGHLSGNRGTISARSFFGANSQTAMQHAASTLSALIDDMIRKEFK